MLLHGHDAIDFVIPGKDLFTTLLLTYEYLFVQSNRLHNQAEYLHQHAGHEAAHGRMGLIIIVSLVAFQFVLLYWKKHHYRSYQGITTIGLW